MKKTRNDSTLTKRLQAGANKADRNGSAKVPKANDLRKEHLSITAVPKGIHFGKEHKSAQGSTSKSTPNELGGFIKNGLSHGLGSAVAGLFGASNLLSGSGFGSIGSAISGFASLFGGGAKQQPVSLPSFSLPGSEVQNISLHREDTDIATGEQNAGQYGRLPDQGASAPFLADQHQQIAQAVKTALLQSHSLSDVISEL